MLIIITLRRPLIIFPHPKFLKLHRSILGNRKNRHINIWYFIVYSVQIPHKRIRHFEVHIFVQGRGL